MVSATAEMNAASAALSTQHWLRLACRWYGGRSDRRLHLRRGRLRQACGNRRSGHAGAQQKLAPGNAVVGHGNLRLHAAVRLLRLSR